MIGILMGELVQRALRASTHRPIEDYFGKCYTDPPVAAAAHPVWKGGDITMWLQHCIYEHCFVPILDDGPNYEYFYCTICSGWKKVSTSTSHIRIHYESASHSDQRFLEEHAMPRTLADRLSKSVILFILENGLAFRLIDDIRLGIVPGLPHRERLKVLSCLIARKIMNIIKSLLANVAYCSLSIDEWCDLKRDRYLGVSCHTMLNDELKVFTLGHISLNQAIRDDKRDHVYASDIKNLLDYVARDYEISRKVLMVVTDNAASMKAAVSFWNDQRISDGLSPVLWGSCICHTINLLLTDFVKLLSGEINEVIRLQQKLMGSEVFEARLTRLGSRVTRIPGYTEVRWYSLFSLCDKMRECKKFIIDYYIDEGLGVIDNEIWVTIDNILPVLTVIKRAVKALEGEIYGTICYVLVAFDEIKKAVDSLVCKGQKYADISKRWNECFEARVNGVREIWSPLLEVGCYLNPGVDHGVYLSGSDMQKVREFIERDSDWTSLTLLSALNQMTRTRSVDRRSVRTSYATHTDHGETTVVMTRETMGVRRTSKRSPLLELMSSVAEQSVERERDQQPTVWDELNVYSGLKKPGLDPEEFWRTNAEELPRLSAVAKKVMAVIPSSASCERTFSASKRIEGLHRAHMDRKVYEDQVIICANNDLAEAAYDAVIGGE